MCPKKKKRANIAQVRANEIIQHGNWFHGQGSVDAENGAHTTLSKKNIIQKLDLLAVTSGWSGWPTMFSWKQKGWNHITATMYTLPIHQNRMHMLPRELSSTTWPGIQQCGQVVVGYIERLWGATRKSVSSCHMCPTWWSLSSGMSKCMSQKRFRDP